MPAWLTALGVRQRRSRAHADPFDALEVQLSLARLEGEIDRLRRYGGRDFAQAHHLRAAMLAYDQLLTQACRMAGIDPPTVDRVQDASGVERNGQRPEDPGSEVARVLAVTALDARGWRW
jgi:hypothetical protein